MRVARSPQSGAGNVDADLNPTSPDRLTTRAVAELRPYPRASVIPPMDRASRLAVKASVAAQDILVPLDILADGTVLDGRGRLGIATELGLDRVPVRIVAPDDPFEYMATVALQRRHLSQSQRAALGIELEQYHAAQAAGRTRQELTRTAPGEQVGAHVVAALPPPVGKARDVAARIVGVSPRLIQDAKFVQQRDADRFADVQAGRTTASAAARKIRLLDNRALAEATPSPSVYLAGQRFRCLVVDPAWPDDNGRSGPGDRARLPYAAMSLEKIGDLPIAELADPDGAHLFLWITNHMLPHAFELLDRWGFEYITPITWCKPGLGTGAYFRTNTEQAIFGVRGNLRLLREDLPTWFEAPRGPLGHSSKPDMFYDIVRHASPGPRVELFARHPREGFTIWGAGAQLPQEAGR